MKKAKLWMRNLLFLSVTVVGFVILTLFLMGAQRVPAPQTFEAGAESYREIESIAAAVDRDFQEAWRKSALRSAPAADQLTVARRLALGLAGTLPSLQEIREMENLPKSEQIPWWVSRLLEDRRTGNHVAERLARALVGVEDGPFVLYRRRRFVNWLSDQFMANRPYHEIVNELLTDEGLWTDSPAVNFVSVNINPDDDSGRPDPVRMAGRTSRAFLGMRIDCLQCHDDFLGSIHLGSVEQPSSGQQIDFHSLAAYFSGVQTTLVGIRDEHEARPYRYQLLDEHEPAVIQPQVPFNRHLVSDAAVRRQQLADWVTHPENRPFARAIVNRVWAIMSGRPMIEPVDDIPLSGPFPPGMEFLVDDLIEHQFNLHRLIRIVATTKVFQQDSHTDFEITPEHAEQWAVFPLSRLRPDQVAGSIVQSTSLTTIDSTAHIITRLTKFGQQNEFVDRYGDAGEDEFADRGETVTQRLLMLNGSMVQQRLSGGLNAPLHIAWLAPNAQAAVETIFLATLSRRPSPVERDHFATQIQPLSGDEQSARIEDLHWTLINSTEFIWNH